MKNLLIDRNEFVPSHDWSISNALHMMKLSYAVYAGTTDNVGQEEDWSITENLVRNAGYDMHKIEARKGIYEPNAMVCMGENRVFLVFRGTEPTAWNQWATDANTVRTPFCIGEVHRGFSAAVDLIWPEILSSLKKADPDREKPLFVGGHSLGAGMSQVASAKLAFEESNIHPAAVYLFGCPRALNSDGAALYNEQLGSRTFRIVNNNDVVCTIPLKTMGFSHIGQMKYLTSDGRLLESPSSAQVKREGLLGVARGLADFNPVDFATDHLPHHYTKRLLALRN